MKQNDRNNFGRTFWRFLRPGQFPFHEPHMPGRNPGKSMSKNNSIKMRMKSRDVKWQLLNLQVKYLIPLLILSFINVSHPEAQGAYFWSEQERIPEYFDSTEESPYLIADTNRTVHAFNSQPLDLENPEGQRAVFYRQWTIESGWTSPNDILFDVGGSSIYLLGAADDQSGKVHLALLMNNENLYYSQAYLSEAGNAIAWSTPVFLGENARPPTTGFERVGSIATDSTGNNIVITYSGSQLGNGLYSVNSYDGGNSWTDPYPVYLAVDSEWVISDPKLYSGESGIVHSVWGTRNQEGHGELGYYANFDLARNVWTEPIELDISGMGAPSVIEHAGNIFVSYILNDVNANMWRQSMDGGKTWTNPSRLSPRHVGSNGLVSFVVDSNDTLHAFFGQRIDDNNHGMWHTVWTGYSWTSAVAVVRGPKIRDVIGGKGFDPNSARAVVVNGNVALVAWSTDGSSGTNGAWYSYKKLDAPALPTLLLPTPSALADQVSTDVPPIVTEIDGVENIPGTLPQDIRNVPHATGNPQITILAGIIPVLIVVVGVLFLRQIHYSRKK